MNGAHGPGEREDIMNASKRHAGRAIRRIVRLDRAWKAGDRQEGLTENALCWRLGQAYRAGYGPAAERARRQNG